MVNFGTNGERTNDSRTFETGAKETYSILVNPIIIVIWNCQSSLYQEANRKDRLKLRRGNG